MVEFASIYIYIYIYINMYIYNLIIFLVHARFLTISDSIDDTNCCLVESYNKNCEP